jgi:hypothetical protein
VCRSEADKMLTERSDKNIYRNGELVEAEVTEGGICEQVFLGSLGERAIIPILLAAGDDSYYSIWSNPTLTRVYSTAAEDLAHTEENPTCTKIKYIHPEWGEWKVQSSVAKYNSTLCAGIIDEYFVPTTVHPLRGPEYHEESWEDKARNISLEGLLDPISSLIMPTECQSEWKKFACGAVFMPPVMTPVMGDWGGEFGNFAWVFDGFGTNEPDNGEKRNNKILTHLNMPSFLHQDQCQTLLKACDRFIDYVNDKRAEEGKELIDVCGTKIKGFGSAFDGKPQFPNLTMFPLLSLGGPMVPSCKKIGVLYSGMKVDLIITVFTPTRVLNYTPFDTVVRKLACPYPLLEVGPGTDFPAKQREGVLFTGCAIPCPQPFWPYYYHVVIKWYLVFIAWVCFMAISYTCVTFSYFKRLRKQRQTLIFSGCTWMMCWSQVMMSFWSKDFHHICTQDNLNIIDQSDGFTVCLFQSLILMYFATGCTYWWLLVAIDLSMKVYNKMKWAVKFRTQFMIAQGLPILWCIYFGFWEAMGNQGLHMCWVSKLGVLPKSLSKYGTSTMLRGEEKFTVNNIDKPWYFSIMLNLIVGMCLMFATMFKIASVDNKASSKKGLSENNSKKENSKKEKGKIKLGTRQKKTIKVAWLSCFII